MTEQQVREKNLYYYSLISRYITALDEWIAAPKSSPQKREKRMICQQLEPLLRKERDLYKGKVEPIDVLSYKKPKQMTIDL